jgi:HK97 family phage major capsid protein
MKLSKKEFAEQAKLAGKLEGDARDAFVANLKSAQVIDTDSEGNEVAVTVELLDIPQPEKKAAEPKVEIKAPQPASLPVRPTTAPEPVVEHITGKSAVFKDNRAAYRFGQFLKAQAGHKSASEWCDANGLSLKHNSFQDAAGGFLVPDEFRAQIITLVSEYGVARQLGELVPMQRDTLSTPKLASNLTASFVGQANSGTTSNNAFTSVNLSAKKVMALTTATRELLEDSPISVVDFVGQRIAYAIALREDSAVVSGDGTATHGGINGLTNRLSTINGIDDGGGLVLGSGNLWSELVLNDFTSVQGRLPSYAWQFGGPSWLCSRSFFYGVMKRLAYNSGGTTPVDITSGNIVEQFLGRPVLFTDAMPSTQANSQIACLFGNFRAAATFGDRRQLASEIATTGTVSIGGSSVDLFATDQVAVKATTRFDYVFHDTGDASTAGAVVGLITAAS